MNPTVIHSIQLYNYTIILYAINNFDVSAALQDKHHINAGPGLHYLFYLHITQSFKIILQNYFHHFT